MRKIISCLLFVGLSSCNSTPETTKPESVKPSKFEPTIESLQQYESPKWFRDAKFGIYLHWGPYSVAEQGEWYARRLYEENRPEYKYHLEHYGHPSEFGYKDLIPMWKAEKFDPDLLVALFKRAGAKYFTPCAVHHDNFDLWDSKYQKWNSVNMGPKKDIIKLWREATLNAGLHFGVTTHLSRSYSWLNTANGADSKGPKKGVPYDGAQGEGVGLYPPKHKDTHPRAPLNAPKQWRDLWEKRMKDLIDNYDPELLYFDCAIPFRGNDNGQTGLSVIAHLYNHSASLNSGRNQAVMSIKERVWQGLYADGVATVDYERGKAGHILSEPWQTDDSLGSWGYNGDWPYTTSGAVIDKLIDIVSKNGNLLLNVPIRANGTLDATATHILEDIGSWMEVNGEAIYGTRPWYMFGEGPTVDVPSKVIESPYTTKDIRYTTKGDTLYVFVLDWPGNEKPLALEQITDMNTRIGKVESIGMLGVDDPIKWTNDPDGLKVWFPEHRPNEYAYVLKMKFSRTL